MWLLRFVLAARETRLVCGWRISLWRLWHRRAARHANHCNAIVVAHLPRTAALLALPCPAADTVPPVPNPPVRFRSPVPVQTHTHTHAHTGRGHNDAIHYGVWKHAVMNLMSTINDGMMYKMASDGMAAPQRERAGAKDLGGPEYGKNGSARTRGAASAAASS